MDNRTRPGERVAKRRRCKTSVGAAHKIKRDETVKWFKSRFEVRESIMVDMNIADKNPGYRPIKSLKLIRGTKHILRRLC
jgi:hypothetical protein